MEKPQKKLLYLSPISWKFLKARPQFIAGHAAKNGFEAIYLSRTPFGKGLWRTRKEKISDTLTAWNICVVPLALRFLPVEKFNNFRLKRLIAGEKFDLIIIGDPRLTGVLPENCETPVFFDCMDRNPDFYTGKVRELVRIQEEKLCRLADGIVVSAQKLKEYLIKNYAVPAEKIEIVRNAAADDFLETAENSDNSDISPADLLYVGTIDRWFDWEAVTEFAVNNPSLKVRLAGPAAAPPDDLPPNVELYGKVPHHQVPALIRNSRLMIIPFCPDPLIEAVDPVKLYEYLALGKNVLSSYWQELESFLPQERLHFYRSSKEFAEKAAGILKNNASVTDTPDRDFHAANNWSIRGEAFFNFVNRMLRKKPSRN